MLILSSIYQHNKGKVNLINISSVFHLSFTFIWDNLLGWWTGIQGCINHSVKCSQRCEVNCSTKHLDQYFKSILLAQIQGLLVLCNFNRSSGNLALLQVFTAYRSRVLTQIWNGARTLYRRLSNNNFSVSEKYNYCPNGKPLSFSGSSACYKSLPQQ